MVAPIITIKTVCDEVVLFHGGPGPPVSLKDGDVKCGGSLAWDGGSLGGGARGGGACDGFRVGGAHGGPISTAAPASDQELARFIRVCSYLPFFSFYMF